LSNILQFLGIKSREQIPTPLELGASCYPHAADQRIDVDFRVPSVVP